MLGWFYAMTMLVTAPFGAFAGWLSEMNRVLPFILTSVMVLVTMAVGMKLAADIEKEIERYKERLLPAIILIPGVYGNTGAGVRGVSKCVEQAVGSDILFGEE